MPRMVCVPFCSQLATANLRLDKRREEAPCYHVSNANSVEHEEQDAADPGLCSSMFLARKR